MPTSSTCTHIKVTGVRCASPSLRGEQFCYFHQHAHRGVRKPPQSRLHPIAILEDEESIQSSLMEVINALMRNTIDLKRAELILRALHIAVKNARRVKFDIHAGDTVKEIPNYAASSNRVGADAFVRPSGEAAVQLPAEAEMPAEAMQPADEQTEDAFPPTASIPPDRTLSAAEKRSAAKFKHEQAGKAEIRANLTRIAESLRPATTHMRTAAPGCSSGPEVSGRSALPHQSTTVAPHNYTAEASPGKRLPQPSRLSNAGNPESTPTKRKPSVSLSATSKQRKPMSQTS